MEPEPATAAARLSAQLLSKVRGPCSLLLTFAQIFRRRQRSIETLNKERQLSEFYRSQTCKRDRLWLRSYRMTERLTPLRLLSICCRASVAG